MIGVRVFVGSPNDVQSFRNSILRVIEDLRLDLDEDNITISGKDWQRVAGDIGDPQSIIDPDIVRTDLLIVVIGHRVGEGTRKELQLGRKLRAKGKLQSVMVYFQKMPPTMLSNPSSEAQEVIALREQLSGDTLYHEFTEQDDLKDLVRRHLVSWLLPLRSLRRFQRNYVGRKLDVWLTQALNVPNPPPIDEAISLEKIAWNQELPDGNDVYDYRRYLASPDGRPYDVNMLGCYRIARYLFRQVLAEQTLVFRDRPFTTFIHRYLADHVRQALEEGDPMAARFLQTLHGWLASRKAVFINARSFAAYQIGMCRDRRGRNLLLETLENSSEDQGVRRYAALALGMIRTRDAIEALIDVHDRAETPVELQTAIGHAILAAGGLLPRPA
jgi:hypothetical protein